MRIDPRLVIEFAAVAEEASFAKAAGRLRIAQPWLSARIRRLEGLLGVSLLERTTRRVALTEEGRAFLDVARSVAAAADAANAVGSRLQRHNAQRLRIGAAPYTKIIRQRQRAIEGFVTRNRNISLELETGWSLALLDRLREGSIDLTFLVGAFDETIFESLTLRRFGVAITMSRSHPLAGNTSVTLADLAGQRIEVFTRSLNPGLWDDLYEPLLSLRPAFHEVPEMAEGPPDAMADARTVAAFFDFGTDSADAPQVVRLPLRSSKTVPFSLLRRRGFVSPASRAFWAAAEVLDR
jgi:DNA-binding transcriptional LysR family regulator